MSRKKYLQFLSIVTLSGFPYSGSVTEDVYESSITLALHLPVEDMEMIFEKYVCNAEEGKINKKHYALFVDKIAILRNKPQIFGTQYKISNDKKITFLPILDPQNLDKRRDELGIPPHSDYEREIVENIPSRKE